MPQTLTACLWFDGKAEEAMNFYLSIFRNAKIGSVSRYGESGPGQKGTVMVANFRINGQDFMGLNGGPMYSFTPAISLAVPCDTQGEVDYLWDSVGEGGAPNRCGWVTDKFGVSWQIVPRALGQLMSDKDAAKSGRVMKAMLGMAKIDIAALQRAYDGA